MIDSISSRYQRDPFSRFVIGPSTEEVAKLTPTNSIPIAHTPDHRLRWGVEDDRAFRRWAEVALQTRVCPFEDHNIIDSSLLQQAFRYGNEIGADQSSNIFLRYDPVAWTCTGITTVNGNEADPRFNLWKWTNVHELSNSGYSNTTGSADLIVKYIDLSFSALSQKGVVERRIELKTLRDRLTAFTLLEQDWAGDGSEPVARRTADEAMDVIAALPRRFPLPQISASGEGEVVLTWFNSSDRLEAIVAPDLYLTWVSRVEGRNRRGKELDLQSVPTAAQLLGDGLAGFYG